MENRYIAYTDNYGKITVNIIDKFHILYFIAHETKELAITAERERLENNPEFDGINCSTLISC